MTSSPYRAGYIARRSCDGAAGSRRSERTLLELIARAHATRAFLEGLGVCALRVDAVGEASLGCRQEARESESLNAVAAAAAAHGATFFSTRPLKLDNGVKPHYFAFLAERCQRTRAVEPLRAAPSVVTRVARRCARALPMPASSLRRSFPDSATVRLRKRETVALGTATDPYQQCEGRYRITRRTLEALVASPLPLVVITKGSMVVRDIDLLMNLDVKVCVSIGTVSEQLVRQQLGEVISR